MNLAGVAPVRTQNTPDRDKAGGLDCFKAI